MRATWKGNVVIQGAVTMPIALFTPASSKQPQFKRIRASDSSPIKQQLIATADGKPVGSVELAKGYPVGNGFKTFTDGEITIPGPGKNLQVNAGQFVPRDQIPEGLRRGYYYVATEEHTSELYESLRRVMETEGLVAVTEFQMRQTLYTAAIVPQEDHLELWTLWWADEVRALPARITQRRRDVRPETEQVVRMLATSMIGTFEHRDNPAKQRLEELLEGKSVVMPEGDNVIHLGDTLDILRGIVEKLPKTTQPKTALAEEGAA